MRAFGLPAAAFAAALAACSPAPIEPPQRPGSRGLRADQHLDAAREHERRAQELARWPETRAGGAGVVDDRASGLWYRRWDTAREEERMAASHRASAAQIHADYEATCGPAPRADATTSILRRFGLGGTSTPDGVVVYLDPQAGSAEQVLRALRCHRAWMMLATTGMDDCPLDLSGLRVVAHGDLRGVSVELTVTDPRLVSELQRRATLELEAARSAAPPAP
jgi:hypothetical protein